MPKMLKVFDPTSNRFIQLQITKDEPKEEKVLDKSLDISKDSISEDKNENSFYTSEKLVTDRSWGFEESAALINSVQMNFDDMNDPRKRKTMWESVSAELEGLGYKRTPKQCSDKWKNLIRTYKTCKESKTKSGRGPVRFMYFDLIDSFLGENYSINDSKNDIHMKLDVSSADAINEEKDPLSEDNFGIDKNEESFNSGEKSDRWWGFAESEALIKCVEANYDDMCHPRKRKTMWENVSNEMENLGYSRTPKQCTEKWKNLYRTYKNCKYSKMKSGRGPVRFMYFELMDKFLGDKPLNSISNAISIGAKNVPSTSAQKEIPPTYTEKTTDNINETEISYCETSVGNTYKTRKRKSHIDEYFRIKIEDFKQRKGEKEREKQKREQRHNERMGLLREKIKIEKLILNELKKKNEILRRKRIYRQVSSRRN